MYLILPDGRSLNHELVAAGMAWWYRRYAKGDAALAQLEAETRTARRGLWGDPHAVAPGTGAAMALSTAERTFFSCDTSLIHIKLPNELRMQMRRISVDRRAVVKKWMDEQERTTGYIARKLGYSPQWISYVMNGRRPFSDQLAFALQETLGIQFDDTPRAKPGKQPASAKTSTPKRPRAVSKAVEG